VLHTLHLRQLSLPPRELETLACGARADVLRVTALPHQADRRLGGAASLERYLDRRLHGRQLSIERRRALNILAGASHPPSEARAARFPPLKRSRGNGDRSFERMPGC
jgi:hypothetical protein